MRRALMLLLLCLLLTGCTAQLPVSTEDEAVPAPVAEEALIGQEAATLWFRFEQEPYLAPEMQVIATSPTEPYETSLLRALTAGPSASQTELGGLFPDGVQVMNTYRQGRRLFVTLTRHIMNPYPDERGGYGPDATLRRELAMQGIAATVTENCDVDEVIILVEQSGQVTDSLRLRQQYYLTGEEGLAAPLKRDESLLLTPATALNTMLQCWSERDFARLYRYAAWQNRPSEAEFVDRMASLPHLAVWAAQPGNVSADGRQATFAVDATLLDGGRMTHLSGAIFRLTRDRGLWRIPVNQLFGREEDMP